MDINVNYIDAISAVLLIVAAFRGYKRGLVIMVGSFIALIAGIWASVKFSGFITIWMIENLGASSPYLHIISFSITFIIIVIVIYMVAFLFSKFLDMIALGLLNRLLGSVFGMLKMLLLISVVIILITAFDTEHNIISEQQLEESLICRPLKIFSDRLIPFLEFDNFTEKIDHYFLTKLIH